MTAHLRTLLPPLCLLPLLAGCPSPVKQDYEEARRRALTEPPPPGPDWRPDALLTLSPALVDDAIAAALAAEGRLTEPFEVKGPLGLSADVTPDLAVDRLRVRPSDRCPSCLSVDAALSGDLAWTSSLGRGRSPVSLSVDLDAAFAADRAVRTDRTDDGDVWRITVTPSDVRRVDLSFGRRGALPKPIEGHVAAQLRQLLATHGAPIPVAEIGGELPLRAVRLATTDQALAVEMLTVAADPVPIATSPPRLADGWQLDVSQGSLLSVARAAAFRAGPVARGVVVEPRTLDIDPSRFEMDIRLWKTTGRGWWRDYAVEGDVGLTDDGISLVATGVTEGPKSRGAAFADPLSALAEGLILRAVERSFAASLPASRRQRAGSLRTEIRATELFASDGVLSARGELDVAPPGEGRPDRRDAPRVRRPVDRSR